MVSRDVVLESLTIAQPRISQPSGHHSSAFSISTQSDAALPKLPLPQRVVLMHLVAELLRKIILCIPTVQRSVDLSSEAGKSSHALLTNWGGWDAWTSDMICPWLPHPEAEVVLFGFKSQHSPITT